MRAGWFKIGVVAAVLALVVAGYLIGRSNESDEQASEGSPAAGSRELADRVEAIRGALSGAGQLTMLRTERCPTQGVGGGYVRPPATVAVRMPASYTSLVAYAATNGTLLPAPARWECTAGLGSDGSAELGAGPIGSVRVQETGGFSELRPHGSGVRATLIPACAGCIASAICSFFPRAAIVKAYEPYEPCEGKPEGEVRFRVSPSAFVFLDPPRVHGSSAGSGGSFPSLGVLSYSPAMGVRQLGCTVAPSEMDACAQAIVAFVAFGHRR